MTKKPSPRKTRAKTSKQFVLRVAVDCQSPLSRAEIRRRVQRALDEGWAVLMDENIDGDGAGFKSARLTNADIP